MADLNVCEDCARMQSPEATTRPLFNRQGEYVGAAFLCYGCWLKRQEEE